MYVLMGANGNITSNAARRLLERGAKVRVIGRDAGHLRPLQDVGAEAAVGNALDVRFLTASFRDAAAVYTMIPPDLAARDSRAYQEAMGKAIVQALVESGVRIVVNLSSVGAALPGGTGPIAGLHDQEQRLNKLDRVDILHLRPGYFMENHLHAIELIKAGGVYPDMMAPEVPIPMIATDDIAAFVARELEQPDFHGHVVRHLLGARSYTMTEAARILGAAIGKPDLKYVQANPVHAKAGMVQAGISPSVADQFEEMSRALSDGSISATYTRDADSTTPTTLEAFAGTFARAFEKAGVQTGELR